MQTIPIIGLKKEDIAYQKALQEAVKILKRGGVIIHPTETCYGLAADIFNEMAVKKVYEIKKMPFSKPVSILVSSIEEAKKYGEWNELAEKYAEKHWPGPLTLILKRKDTIPKFLNPNTDSIGIRFPSHEFSVEIVKNLGTPIITTSANISSKPPPYAPEQIYNPFDQKKYNLKLFIDGGILDSKVPPSTILNVIGKEPVIIRKGSIDIP